MPWTTEKKEPDYRWYVSLHPTDSENLFMWMWETVVYLKDVIPS